jgi:hypothetical protein
MPSTDIDPTAQKKPQQQVLEASQRDIQPARQPEIPAEGPLSEPPEVLGHGADGTEPGAETLPRQPRHPEEGDEQEHAGRMQRRDIAGGEEDL